MKPNDLPILDAKGRKLGQKAKACRSTVLLFTFKASSTCSASTWSTSSYHVQDQDLWVKAILVLPWHKDPVYCYSSTLLLISHFSFFENRKQSKFFVALSSFHVQGRIFGSRLLCVPFFCGTYEKYNSKNWCKNHKFDETILIEPNC